MRRFYQYLLIIPVLVFCISAGKYQSDISTAGFMSPVKHPIRLSGTFGELRSNHFHSGIDIKSSNGVSGDPVYAPADGYVSRIKVQKSAYGNALYITHPNGYTTVYAHFQKFEKNIADYVRSVQYERERFEVNIYPSSDRFRLKQGDLIGYLGNSGGSTGPHLHFETRNSRNQKPVNPLQFGFDIVDTRAPDFRHLKIYHLAEDHHIFHQSKHKLPRAGDTLEIAGNLIGLGVKVYDLMNYISNLNGVYALRMFADNAKVFEINFDAFAFHETRYLNAHLDYGEKYDDNGVYNRCFKLPGNHLSMYDHLVNDGVLQLTNRPINIKIEAQDYHKNTSNISFVIKPGKSSMATSSRSATLIHDAPHHHRGEGFEVIIPAGSTYQNLEMQYSASDHQSGNNIYTIHDAHEPVHKYFTLRLNSNISTTFRKKAFIAYWDNEDGWVNAGGKWRGQFLEAKVRQFGLYQVQLDTVKPEIASVRFDDNMTGRSKMQFKITDNFYAIGKARDLRYTASIDGKWVLFEYDYKNDLITHYFDDHLTSGEHLLELKVWDDRGNSSTLKRTFFR